MMLKPHDVVTCACTLTYEELTCADAPRRVSCKREAPRHVHEALPRKHIPQSTIDHPCRLRAFISGTWHADGAVQ